MSDRDWRSWERRWQADPGDQDALQRAIAARCRAGVPVPGWMFERRVSPGHRFESDLPLSVSVLDPDGRPREVGRTPGGLDVPEHRVWWVQPDPPTDAALEEVCAELVAQRIPGLSLRPDVTAAGLAQVPTAPHLARLDLGGCAQVTDAALERLSPLDQLSWLNLWFCPRVSDEGLKALGGLPSLTSLDLTLCGGITDAGLGQLAGLEELYALTLHGCNELTNDGMAHLAAHERLTWLDLRQCNLITDSGLKHLAGLKELTILNLSFCRELTTSGVEQLAGLENLLQLFLVGCGEIDADRLTKRLKEALPRCEVVF